jgi:2-keto-3-deoxy-L-rhamnonate aldolase RhmA
MEQAVRFAKYPPWGIRGIGAERATQWGLNLRDYTHIANQETMVIPLMETVAAGEAIHSILDVEGIDAVFFGPADYSASAGHLGEWEGPGVAEKLLEIKQVIEGRGFPVGVMATSIDDSLKRKQQGFRMIGIGSDTGLLLRAGIEAMSALGTD